MNTCTRCRATRPNSDMGQINEMHYCHPGNSVGDTCYTIESRRLLPMKDLIERASGQPVDRGVVLPEANGRWFD